MESQTNIQSINDHKFYIVDGVPRATIDGEPHEILTLIACLSGLIVAIIIVSIIMLVIREQDQIEVHPMDSKQLKCIDIEALQNSTDLPKIPNQHKITIFTITGSSKGSFDVSC